jgi:putative membrane protein
MNLKFAFAALVGLFIVIGLVVHQGVAQVAEPLGQAGSRLGLVCLLHLPPLACSALAWQVLLGYAWQRSTWMFMGVRGIREAATLLPVAQIGGELVGARVLTIYGCRASVAGASVVVDLTLEVVAQFVFTLAALALLVLLGHYNGTLHAFVIGVLIAGFLLLGFVLAQHLGLFKLLERLLQKMAIGRPDVGLTDLAGLHDTILEIYRHGWRLFWSGALHLLSWVLTSGEVWLALWLMGHPVTFAQAFIVFSLGHAVRSAAFVIPSGLGAQEAGFMVVGAMCSLPPEVALAASLAIRVREVVLGVPGLLAWNVLEGSRVWANR